GEATVSVNHKHLGNRFWYADLRPRPPLLLFTEHETNRERLYGVPTQVPHVKDAFHEAVVGRRLDCVNAGGFGTKAAAHYQAVIPPGDSMVVRTRFVDRPLEDPFLNFDAVVDQRRQEADAFFDT